MFERDEQGWRGVERNVEGCKGLKRVAEQSRRSKMVGQEWRELQRVAKRSGSGRGLGKLRDRCSFVNADHGGALDDAQVCDVEVDKDSPPVLLLQGHKRSVRTADQCPGSEAGTVEALGDLRGESAVHGRRRGDEGEGDDSDLPPLLPDAVQVDDGLVVRVGRDVQTATRTSHVRRWTCGAGGDRGRQGRKHRAQEALPTDRRARLCTPNTPPSEWQEGSGLCTQISFVVFCMPNAFPSGHRGVSCAQNAWPDDASRLAYHAPAAPCPCAPPLGPARPQ